MLDVIHEQMTSLLQVVALRLLRGDLVTITFLESVGLQYIHVLPPNNNRHFYIAVNWQFGVMNVIISK